MDKFLYINDARAKKSVEQIFLLSRAKWILPTDHPDHQSMSDCAGASVTNGEVTLYRIAIDQSTVAYVHYNSEDALLISLRPSSSTWVDELNTWDTGDLDMTTHLTSFGIS